MGLIDVACLRDSREESIGFGCSHNARLKSKLRGPAGGNSSVVIQTRSSQQGG